MQQISYYFSYYNREHTLLKRHPKQLAVPGTIFLLRMFFWIADFLPGSHHFFNPAMFHFGVQVHLSAGPDVYGPAIARGTPGFCVCEIFPVRIKKGLR